MLWACVTIRVICILSGWPALLYGPLQWSYIIALHCNYTQPDAICMVRLCLILCHLVMIHCAYIIVSLRYIVFYCWRILDSTIGFLPYELEKVMSSKGSRCGCWGFFVFFLIGRGDFILRRKHPNDELRPEKLRNVLPEKSVSSCLVFAPLSSST